MGGSRLATRATLKTDRTALMRARGLSRGVGLSWVRIPPPAPNSIFEGLEKVIGEPGYTPTYSLKNDLRDTVKWYGERAL